MILKLIPQQVSDLWDSIRYSIMTAIAPVVEPNPDNLQDILCQLMKQDMQCWCVFGDDKKIYGYIITSVSVDMNTKFRTLLIYSLHLFKEATPSMWKEGIAAMEDFARANKCTRITAYTTDEDVIRLANKLNYKSDCTFLVKDI